MHNFLASFIDMFTTRDFAIITWGIVFLLVALLNKTTSDRTKMILKSIFAQMNNKLFLILTCYFVVLSVAFFYLGTKYGDWDAYMVKDAALWFLFSGLPINIKYIKEKEYFGQLKDTVLANFKVALLFDCVFSTYTFSYVAELFLVLLIIVLGYTLLSTEDKEEHRHVNIATKSLLMLMGFCVVVYVFYMTWVHHSEVFSKLIITELSQPFFFTCFYILSAIVLKLLLKNNFLTLENQYLNSVNHSEHLGMVHFDGHIGYLLSNFVHYLEKFDILHFFFERNKSVVKKIYKKTTFFF